MRVNKLLLSPYFLMLFVLLSCHSRKDLNAEQYLHAIKMSKVLVKKRQIGDLVFNVLYEPQELKILRKLKDSGLSIKKDLVEQELLEIENSSYFTFRVNNDLNTDMEKYGISNYSEFDKRINYLAFKIKDDFYLIQNKDTIACQLGHYERTFGVNTALTLSLAFGKIDPTQSFIFCYHDNTFNAGIVKFQYKKSELNKIPNLKID